jgi:hypothetical protein
MSAPAVLQSSHSGAKSSSEEEVDSDDHTSEKEDEEDNEDGGDGAVDGGKDIADGGGGAVEDDRGADDGEDARSPWESACHRKGRRIMDLPRLLFALEKHTCCRSCSEWMLVQYMRDFAAYYDSEADDGESAADALERFLRSRSGGGHRLRVRLPSHQLDTEVRKGLASRMTFKCNGMNVNFGGVAPRAGHGNAHYFNVFNSDAVPASGRRAGSTASYSVNQQAAVACMATGNGGHGLYEFCSHLSIPLTPSFASGGNSKGYAQCEAAARVSVEAAAAASCLRAEQAEVAVTREMDEEKSLLRRAREVGYDDGSEDDDDDEEHPLPALRKRSRAQVRPGFYEKLQKKILADEAKEAEGNSRSSQESSSDEEFDEMEGAVDTSWPTRGSGHAYKSNCGCTQFVGIQNRQIVGYHTMTKECDTCLRKRNAARAAAKSTGTNEAVAVAAATPAGFKARHDCRENHHGAGKSSKSMEPEGTAAIALAAFSRGAVIRKLCQDDDATTAAVMKRENQQTEVTK